MKLIFPKANQLANFPLNFLRTGFYKDADGKMYDLTSGANWWSSTQDSVANAYGMRTTVTFINTYYNGYRGFGFARCCAGAHHPPNLWQDSNSLLAQSQALCFARNTLG